MASPDRARRRLSLWLFAASLALMALLTVGEIALAQALRWWELDTWLATGHTAAAAAAVVAVALLRRVDHHHRERPRLTFALFLAVVAAGAYGLRLLASLDILWVSFPARATMEVIGALAFDIVIIFIAVVLIALTPAHRQTNVHSLLHVGIACIAGIAAITVITLVIGIGSALDPQAFLGIISRLLLGLGVFLTAVATLMAMQQLETQQDVIDAF